VRQFHEWGNCDQGRHILIAVARYLAAHFGRSLFSVSSRGCVNPASLDNTRSRSLPPPM
jgi:hypothetical protein